MCLTPKFVILKLDERFEQEIELSKVFSNIQTAV
jgi:hypothetical protein